MNITGRGLFGKLCVCEHLRQTYAAVLPASRVIFPAKSAKLWVFRRSFASQNGEALCPVTAICKWKINFAAFGRKVCRFLQCNTGKTGRRGPIRKINFAIIPNEEGKLCHDLWNMSAHKMYFYIPQIRRCFCSTQ